MEKETITERLNNELKIAVKDNEDGLYFNQSQFIKEVINIFEKMRKSNVMEKSRQKLDKL